MKFSKAGFISGLFLAALMIGLCLASCGHKHKDGDTCTGTTPKCTGTQCPKLAPQVTTTPK